MAKAKDVTNTLPDAKLLKELIDSEKLSDGELEAFSSMLEGLMSGKYKKLTPNQKDWAEGIHCSLNLDPGTANLVSSGQVKVTDAQRADLKKFLDTALGPKMLRPPGKK
ncbi:hypothetical protein M0R72_03020 [Candidatus Pacearchaeota archaeon]|jgi:hypothetical protein|nr:hypothetical protein [Candidatus Pacearchaeota archaeon]